MLFANARFKSHVVMTGIKKCAQSYSLMIEAYIMAELPCCPRRGISEYLLTLHCDVLVKT